ncbi:MAG: MFS transporter [Labilithrix sp.]|nr:MFS transporter [Labilithrix sp.]MBX3223489.1 MFS transporter [Labilithrix sp.]
MKEFIEAFKALRHAPRALWLVIFAFAFDAMAYFGVLPLMKAFIGQDIGIRPAIASTWVSLFTGALTLVMLFVGKPTEGYLGIRKSLILALFLSFTGRILYSSAPFAGGAAMLAVSLAVVAIGEGILQPVAYAGVKRYTTEKTGSMGFALLYAGLNFGAMLVGPISAKVRTTFDEPFKAGQSTLSGFNAVNWVCVGVTAFTLVVFALFMTKKVEAEVVRGGGAPEKAEDAKAGYRDNAKKDAPPPGKSPFKDPRFLFFIFALLPVRTLFAHQWLTMPEYVLRSYPHEIADRMEWLVDSVNPLIIFLGVPTITALTKRFHVLSMMIIGSLVSAAATFLLVPGPDTKMLITYFVVFSIGEALWSSRFLEYAAELAPEGRVAQYMGVANLPWFVAKTTTGFYSGVVLEHFVPKEGPQSTGTMWLFYGAIAMLSPVSLIVASKWIRSGMATKAAAA